jgi:tetratricopeptide (TPR) repeat protein
MKTKHEQEMLAQYQEYLEQDPDNTKLILAVSECHLNLGEIFEAEDIIEVALANHPQHPELLFQLATIKLMTDEATVAIRLLQQLKTIGIKHASISPMHIFIKKIIFLLGKF